MNKYNENGPMGLSYSEMNWLFETSETLLSEIEFLKKRNRSYQEALLSVNNSDTLEQAKRVVKIVMD
jgi:hypothetical protein